ncbi:Gfo/Idh/MocA family oxidoreductase [Flavobacterium sp. LHD-80]|uniref:Gfo/Idh/MocA family protein n=1 Tax=Flavobacterium sp. LHD-80 TaxID=3071411 RepID=UPI0027E1A28A|nr:Gfo/Idh/MocA family oxidoreductase [Flavobacterium sp. LHD-80]MDQ6473018.1 Gfo/Idh/MocA family oxidoreductase [Flavobacterium sp. LHD-80]
MSDSRIKWGIIGLGNIAHQFVKDLALVEEAELYAVASRDLHKAKTFAATYNALFFYDDYNALFDDAKVEIVYIATTHDLHASLTIKALQSKKAVLCEKPIAVNYAQAFRMVQASKDNNCFFMEALWTRFNPSIREVLLKIKQGEIGDIKYINADFAFSVQKLNERMTDLNLAGGSLLDMGIYPLFLVYAILGRPDKIMALASFFDSGADAQTSMILQYKTAQAILHSSFVSPSNMEATISGLEGRITINSIWHEAQSYSVVRNNHKVDYALPTKGKGFTYEIEECHFCLKKKQIESKLWSHQNSLDLMAIVDSVRKEIGLIYPSDKE